MSEPTEYEMLLKDEKCLLIEIEGLQKMIENMEFDLNEVREKLSQYH